MASSRLLKLVLLAAVAAVALAPAASAHTSVFSADKRVRVVVGQLNEPVSTYAVSGLDVCFQENTTARAPIAGINAGGISATLRAPNGQTLHQDLKAQFGKTGCFTFAEPYVLTLPGQYVVDLSGSVNGSAVAVTNVAAGGAVVDRADITFPDNQVPSDLALEARVNELQARIVTLEAAKAPAGKNLPMPVAAWLLIALATLAAVRRAR